MLSISRISINWPSRQTIAKNIRTVVTQFITKIRLCPRFTIKVMDLIRMAPWLSSKKVQWSKISFKTIQMWVLTTLPSTLYHSNSQLLRTKLKKTKLKIFLSSQVGVTDLKEKTKIILVSIIRKNLVNFNMVNFATFFEQIHFNIELIIFLFIFW